MTSSPSEAAAPSSAALLAERYAAVVGAESWSGENGTPKIYVSPDRWVDAHRALAESLPYFSWLSAIDWAAEVAVGDPPEEEPEERFELLSCLGEVVGGEWIVLSTNISKEDAAIATVSEVFGGADWHEREAAEMFGITFVGHPNLIKLYLPDAFEGHPLRKTFPLLSREVKPWPGTVDVEDMPSTENPEAGDA